MNLNKLKIPLKRNNAGAQTVLCCLDRSLLPLLQAQRGRGLSRQDIVMMMHQGCTDMVAAAAAVLGFAG